MGARKHGVAWGSASFDDASTELVKFATDFEAKILQPVRDRRAANDEVLAIKSVPLGSVRDPQWDGVVDGEACGQGDLAESIRKFLHWVPIKLQPNDALRLCVSCGDALAREGEFSSARDQFYRYVISICDQLELDRVPKPEDLQDTKEEGSGARMRTRLTLDEACWAARAKFGVAAVELRLVMTRDPHVQFPTTLSRMLTHLRGIQRGMDLLFRLPTELHDSASWLVLEGTVMLFEWCEPLTVLGHGGSVAEFLAWCILAMESIVNLGTVKHLPWRTRLVAATCDAFESSGNPGAGARCVAHAMEKIQELRRQEGMDPPIPPLIKKPLDTAESDMRLLTFKFAVVTAANARRSAGATAKDRTVNQSKGKGDKEQDTLSDQEITALMEQYIPDHTKRPAALLELLGQARGIGRSGSGNNGTGLNACEALTACRLAISALISAEDREVSDEASTTIKDRENLGHEGEEKGQQHEKVKPHLVPFLLDIDQEMQLMRTVYQLGQLELLQSLLPSTKRRLRDAPDFHSPDDCRAFWFEIALWTACGRLPTWKYIADSQAAARGGLKRSGTSVSGVGSNNMSGSKDLAYTPGSGVKEGNVPPFEPGIAEGVHTVKEEEQELRDALFGVSPPEVVEIVLEKTDRVATKINLAPLVTAMYLVREALFGSYRHILERREDSVLSAAMLAWEPYVASLIRALDTMPAGAEVERPLLDALLLSLETLHACFSMLDADDAALRATIALRLAILQADFRGDHRKACQTLRSGLGVIDKYRQTLSSAYLHGAPRPGDTGIDFTNNVYLARSSVTASFNNEVPTVVGPSNTALNPDGVTFSGRHPKTMGRPGPAMMASHELAALQSDLMSTLFRVELLMGRVVASDMEKHKRDKAEVKLEAQQSTSKSKKSIGKVSKVTFGGSSGRFNIKAGSLGVGWSVSLPLAARSSTKALMAENSVVYAAGAGPLCNMVTVDTKVSDAQDLGLCIASVIEGLDGTGVSGAELQLGSCPATEARLISEFRRNPYARAVLLATMARFRADRGEQKGLLTEAAKFLRQARDKEEMLLRMLPSITVAKGESTSGKAALVSPPRSTFRLSPQRRASSRKIPAATPPPPFLLSRSYTSVELLPAPFSLSSYSGYSDAVEINGTKGYDRITGAALAPNTTPNNAERAGMRISKLCVYGKPEGAGTAVTLSNTGFAGLGIPIPYDSATGVCGPVSVRGLAPNESYVFAVAAFDENGDLIGDGVGSTCAPVETLNPLPLPLCWAQVSRTSLALGFPYLAGQSAKKVYSELTNAGPIAKLPAASGRQIHCRDSSEGKASTSGVCNAWMDGPLYGQTLNPKLLAQCPTGVLQTFVQACFILVETLDDDAISKAGEGGGAPYLEQVLRLTSLKRLSLACEVAVLLQDWDLVPRGVWKAYHLLLPLLRIQAMGRILFQVLCHLHQYLALVPRDDWDSATRSVFACLAHQITIKGHEIGEQATAVKALLGNISEPEASPSESTEVFKEERPDVEGKGSTSTSGLVSQQIALLEIWMGLQGYQTERDQSSILRRALALSASYTNFEDSAAGKDGQIRTEADTVNPSAPKLEVLERIIPEAYKNPTKAWELLNGETSVFPTERARLMCRVCRIALDCGLPKKVVSWLGQDVGSSYSLENDGSAGGDARRHFLFRASELEPVVTKVLELEGALPALMYIEVEATETQCEGKDVGLSEGIEINKAPVEETQQYEENTKVGGGRNAPFEGIKSTGSTAEDTKGTLPATSVEGLQLLWLAEAEHILGTAYMQLAFAEARDHGRSESQPGNDGLQTETVKLVPPSRHTVERECEVAAGGRRPWGYASGPFASFAASAEDIIEQDWSESDEQVEEAGGDGDDAEHCAIEQLEDEGARWSSVDGIISTVVDVKGKADDSVDEGKDALTTVDESVAKRASFSIHLSKAMLHLAKAASRASCGRFWLKTERTCGLLWNSIMSLWLSPQDFYPSTHVSSDNTRTGVEGAARLGEHHARVYAKACEALLDAVDALYGSHKTAYIGGAQESTEMENANGRSRVGDGNLEQEMDDAFRMDPGGDTKASPDLQWVARFVEWGLQGIVRCRCWGVAVKVGFRLLTSTDGLYAGHRVYPVVIYAQRRLCSIASRLLARRQACLAALDEDFNIAQAKRRRRKVLKAIEAKSKDEIEHEQAREPLMVAVDDARVRKQIHDHHLGIILQSRDSYMNNKKLGRSSLDDARDALAEYLALLSRRSPKPDELPRKREESTVSPSRPPQETPRGDSSDGVDLKKSLNAVLQLYRRAVDILREKRERELLAAALCDLGALEALRGRYDLASRSWKDAIDGLCSALDSTKHWRVLFEEIRAAHPSSRGARGGRDSLALTLGGLSCITGGTVLSNLSVFTGQSDMNEQLNLCLMAAELFRAPLETSLPFPQRAYEYVSYVPATLGGPGLEGQGLWSDDRSLSASVVYSSLMHVQGVLTAAGKAKEAFPVLAILEHIATKVTMDPRQLARVKLARVECLAEAGFPAEAASALAAVLTGACVPATTGDYAGRSCRLAKGVDRANTTTSAGAEVKGGAKDKKGGKGGAKDKKRGKGKEDKGNKKKGAQAPSASSADHKPTLAGESRRSDDPRQLAKSGLPFYGLSPYNDHLPLAHPENADAVKWLIGEGCTSTDDKGGKMEALSRHARLLKRGLFGADLLNLPELRMEYEACLVARARARLLLTLANCSALPDACTGPEGTTGDDTVLMRVRDATDTILGEILQVGLIRISPSAITTKPDGSLDSGHSGKSETQVLDGGTGSLSSVQRAAVAASAAPTAPGGPDAWVPPIAADALLLRGRLALLDGKLRVCRHHASRGLAVLLRHGLTWCHPHAALESEVFVMNEGSKIDRGIGDKATLARVTFGDEQYQPWAVIKTWLELRHDLAVVALLQGRTADAIFQIESGLEEAGAVVEPVVAYRLRRLRAQAWVAEGDLEQAASDCRTLTSDRFLETRSALDYAAVLRLYSEIRRQQSLVCGGREKRESLRLLSDSLEALRLADSALLSAAHDMGWIGSGTLTYARREDNVMMGEAKPRLLHALGTSFQDLSKELSDSVKFGMVPIDERDVYAPSQLANLYLPSLRLLLSIRVSMLDLMENIGHYDVTLCRTVGGGNDLFEDKTGDVGLAGIQGQETRDKWLLTASTIAEETAAIMRHVANSHPAVRAQLLLLIGKFRQHRVQHLRSSLPVVDTTTGCSSSIRLTARELMRELDESAETVLKAALRVSFARGGHDWIIMADACMGLVLVHLPSRKGGDDTMSERDTQEDDADLSKRQFHQASHYLRLAASITSGHRKLDEELDTVAVEPLPPAVIASMPRSALDELAGRGGRGPEDDPLRLTARGLLQFLRARMREKSLATAPADHMSASAVCQIHSLLYKHVPVYREKCCIEESSIEPSTPGTESGVIDDVSEGTVCAQWVWNNPYDVQDMATSLANDDDQGLYPTRIAVVFLGPVARGTEGRDTQAVDGTGSPAACMITTRVSARKADELRRRASQIKALLEVFAKKTPTAEAIPSSLQERFYSLLNDAARALHRGLSTCSLGGAPSSLSAATGPSASGGTQAANDGVLPTVANVDVLEALFDTKIGVFSVNRDMCRFVRVATAAEMGGFPQT